MKRNQVQSSVITSAGYDAVTKILEIQFKSDGAVWQYSQVPESVFKEFMKASSKGNFFAKEIKRNYPEKRVG